MLHYLFVNQTIMYFSAFALFFFFIALIAPVIATSENDVESNARVAYINAVHPNDKMEKGVVTSMDQMKENRSLRTRSRAARAMKRNGSLLPDIVLPSITSQNAPASAPVASQYSSYYPYAYSPQYQSYPVANTPATSAANTVPYYPPQAVSSPPAAAQNIAPAYPVSPPPAQPKKKEKDDDEEEEDEDEEDEEDFDADDLVTRRRR
ncbi:MAG: hypothetical protein EXX96DRAFT_577131 [Benjaminiella poitrasii]|nr:MAG: hypothetical protein EXX96DRAFT_577131 [Benjaminiella poitrasii]